MEVDLRSEASLLQREVLGGAGGGDPVHGAFRSLHRWRVVFFMAVVRHLWALLSCSYS